MARTRIRLVASLATAAALAAPTTASAATANCGDLQDKLDAAPAFSVVTLDEGATCSNHFDLPSRTITLEGGGSGATLTGQSKGNFQILAGHNVGGTTIRNLTFVEGVSQDNGGAIRLTGDSPVTIEDNTFLGNEADDNGGAVSIDSTDGPEEVLTRGDATPVFLRGNTFGGGEEGDGNDADESGGAVYINEPFRPIVIDEGNRFIANDADGSGGGLYIDEAPELVLIGNVFDGNESGDDGGGAAVQLCFGAEVTDNVFLDNEISTEGGGLEGGGLSIVQSGCNDDKQPRGESGPQVTQSGNVFEGNSIAGASSAHGGGEYIDTFRCSRRTTASSATSSRASTRRMAAGWRTSASRRSRSRRGTWWPPATRRAPSGRSRAPAGSPSRAPVAACSSSARRTRSSASRTRPSRATSRRGGRGSPAGRCGASSRPAAARC